MLDELLEMKGNRQTRNGCPVKSLDPGGPRSWSILVDSASEPLMYDKVNINTDDKDFKSRFEE